MSDTQHNHGGGYLNGLLMGAILGAGAVFLLGTKKGKKVLKAVTENGFENLADLQEMLDSDEFEDGEDEYREEETSKPKQESTSKSKRFFRGIKK